MRFGPQKLGVRGKVGGDTTGGNLEFPSASLSSARSADI